jgi:WD domain, G-beta repeat
MAARIAADPYSTAYGRGYGGAGGPGRGSGAANGGIEDLTKPRGGSPANGSRPGSGAGSYAPSVGGSSAGSAGYALPTLAAASMLNLPPLKSSVVVVAPAVDLPTPASLRPVVQTPSGVSMTAQDFSQSPANNRRAGSRSPSPAATPRGSGTGGTGMYSLAAGAGGAGGGGAGGARRGSGAGGTTGADKTAADAADAAFEEESTIMGTAKKLALPKRVEEGTEMVEYRMRQAKEYNKKMRSLQGVNVMMTRSLGLMCKLRDGHATGVTAVSFVDDGNLLASGAQDGLILIWNLELQKFERVMDNHQSAITQMSWHPDTRENQLVSASADSTVKLWDVDRGTPMITLRDHGRYSVTSAVFSSDGDMLASAGMSKYIIVYNMVRMRANWAAAKKSSRDMMLAVIKPFEDGNEDGHKQGITKICWSKGNDRIISSSEDGTLRVWNIPQGGKFVRALTGHTGAVYDCSYDPNGERLLSAGADSTIRIWNPEEGRCYRVLKDGHKGPILQAVWTPEGGGRRIASIGKTDRQIVLWEAASGIPMQILENLHGASPIYCVAARPDALQIVTGGGDKCVGVWKSNHPGFCDYLSSIFCSCFGGCYKACCDCSDMPEYVDEDGKNNTDEDATGIDEDGEGGGKKKKKKGDDDDDDSDEDAKKAAEGESKAAQEERQAKRKAQGLEALRAHKAARAAGGSASNSGANAAVLEAGDQSDEEMASASPLKGGKKIQVKSKRHTRDYASAADSEIDDANKKTAEGISARVKARDIVADAAYNARSNRGVKR